MDSPGESIDTAEMRRKLASVEADNRSMREEFDAQRAKLKELFLQKEAECRKLNEQLAVMRKELNESKSQVLLVEYKRETDIQEQSQKAQEEIISLQHLVQETVEENGVLKSEIDRLTAENGHIRAHPQTPQSPQRSESTSSTTSLAPVFNHVRKTLVRKLGVESSASNENLDDSMRKVNKYAQEDAEVLRSLVIPLEEEIKALKEKLRSADEENQSLRVAVGGPSIPVSASGSALVGMLNDSKLAQDTTTTTANDTMLNETIDSQPDTDEAKAACEMCRNYESQLLVAQNDKDTLQKDIDRYNEELSKESALRHDLETKWQDKRDKYKEQVQHLKQKVEFNEKEMAAVQRHFAAFKEDVNAELSKLTNERETIHRHMTTLQDDNDFLAARYMASSEEMQNQAIDLPNTVEELQELLLQSHQSLIEARVGCEFEQRKCTSFLDEIQVLRDQLQTAWTERQTSDKEYSARIKHLENLLKTQESERNKLLNLRDMYEKKEVEWNKLSSELRVQSIELGEANEKAERQIAELKNRVGTLQQEMGNSEAVQKDFVRLSQSLQMELEKIRAADTQIRWQDDEDIDDCPSCKHLFTVTRRKHHCRHCGTIYCEKCLTKSVITGRANKPARVCDVCHTLLVRNTAPYFSQAPPQSPH